ncbi:hypothetical protein [Clostridium sp. ZS2-4]|uniref:hypothetical protein n=1 Tax=Clostridium sp. ZS2-4 TaxID=2987703 RepID=UPI00227BD411|nr:hypothetical protein [Clostridium sp. ZS2-4]MCY6354199.1 hypothetical protein [Clostridium sp. ZS2-4]
MIKLITYDSYDMLKKIEIKEYDIIITAYKDSAELIGKIAESVPVIAIGEIIDNIFHFWKDRDKQYENIVNIRKIIENEKVDENLKLRFKKSLNEVYSAIRNAKELLITPDEYRGELKTDEEEFFVKLMEEVYYEKNFVDYDIRVFNYTNNIDSFKTDFGNAVNKIVGKEITLKKKKILLQGFYYITPMQEFILQLLKDGEVDIDYLLLCNMNYDRVNEMINETFKNKEITIENNNSMKNDISDVFANLMDNGFSKHTINKEKIELRIYEDLNTYNKKILDFDSKIYATNRHNIIDRLSIFGGNSKLPGKLSIKYYPIGIFLREIYTTWNKNVKDIIMSYDSLCKIFETGILRLNTGGSSKEYLEDLKNIAHYFIDCETLKQWIERIKLLRENISNCKYKAILEYYGPFTVDKKRIKEIQAFLEQLKNITEIIFFDKDEYGIDMEIHLQNLQTIMINNVNVEDDNEIAVQLLKKIEEILKNRSVNIRINNEYLLEAITFYINSVDEKNLDNIEICTLDSIEGIINDENGEVLICDFDRDNFPLAKLSECWLLNKEKLSEIMKIKTGISKELIFRQLILLQHQGAIGRYVFWMILKYPGKKIFTRLANIDTDNTHLYEKLLVESSELVSKKGDVDLTNNNLTPINIDKYKFNKKSNHKKKEYFMYCPIRYFYYELSDGREVYTDKFCLEHFIPNLMAYCIRDNSVEKINKVLRDLPQLSKLLRDKFRNISRKNMKNKETWEIEDLIPYYPDENGDGIKSKFEKNNTEFYKSIAKQNNCAVNRSIDNIIISDILPLANNKRENCMYCSFRDKCKYAKINEH